MAIRDCAALRIDMIRGLRAALLHAVRRIESGDLIIKDMTDFSKVVRDIQLLIGEPTERSDQAMSGVVIRIGTAPTAGPLPRATVDTVTIDGADAPTPPIDAPQGDISGDMGDDTNVQTPNTESESDPDTAEGAIIPVIDDGSDL